VSREDAVGLVEAAYDVAAPHDAWMGAILRHARALIPDAVGLVGVCCDVSDPRAPRVHGAQGNPEAVLSHFERATRAVTPEDFERTVMTGGVSTLSMIFGAGFRRSSSWEPTASAGGRDGIGVYVFDAQGLGVGLSGPIARVRRPTHRERRLWGRLGSHLANALRLRCSGGGIEEAVLDPGGRALHAEEAARPAAARERLREAVLARDRARTSRIRRDEVEALALWQGLVAGRWSLVDRFESDGRTYVVAQRNATQPRAVLALGLRERQVLGHLAQGHSNKLTGYALGISESRVSETKRGLLLKLGVRTVADVAGLVRQGKAMAEP